jgi:hypothetical protein
VPSFYTEAFCAILLVNALRNNVSYRSLWAGSLLLISRTFTHRQVYVLSWLHPSRRSILCAVITTIRVMNNRQLPLPLGYFGRCSCICRRYTSHVMLSLCTDLELRTT